MAQDTHQQAVERFDAASEAMREQHERMREDLRFSNPSRPEQWDDDAVALRKGRPCLTFDRTNQFISQVVNSGRQNKPAMHCLPADSDDASLIRIARRDFEKAVKVPADFVARWSEPSKHLHGKQRWI